MSRYVTVRKPLDPRKAWFRQQHLGMFVHFGLYSLLADPNGGEWVLSKQCIPIAKYKPLMKRFNPQRFDADEWVAAAKRSGARYLVCTAKHHDGFCLFDSALTDFKITNTPFKRDLIRELIEACRRGGIKIGLYYSQPDWTHPAHPHSSGKDGCPQIGDKPDWPAYLKYYFGQVEELVTKYGKIDGIWFDGVNRSEAEWQGKKIYELIKKHQPHAVVNERAGWGDFYTPERKIATAALAQGYMVEACDSIGRNTWGYVEPDPMLQSSHSIVHALIRLVAAGGNYLPNVGPRGDGSLPDSWMQRFFDMGDWLQRFGNSIYDTTPCPRCEESLDLQYTRKGKSLFLHLLRWPDTNTITLSQLSRKPTSAKVLGSETPLKIEMKDGKVTLQGLPSLPPDAMANVIEMKFGSNAFLRPPKPWPVPPPLKFNGVSPLEFGLYDAPGVFLGIKGVPLPTHPFKGQLPDDLSNIMSQEHKLTWTIDVAKPATVEVTLLVAHASNQPGSEFRIATGKQAIEGKMPKTPDWYGNYKTVRVGKLRLAKGRQQLTMQPTRCYYPFGIVKNITLTPVS